jgi:hypothetical protein
VLWSVVPCCGRESVFPNRTAFMALQAEVNPMIQDDVKDQVGGNECLFGGGPPCGDTDNHDARASLSSTTCAKGCRAGDSQLTQSHREET